MKYISLSLLFTLFICCNSYAEMHDVKYNIHLASYHFDRDYEWNEKNYGVGVEYGDIVYVGVGYFKNSYYENSFYSVVGKDFKIKNVRLGAFLGVSTGYKGRYKYQPVVGGLRLIYHNINLMITPSNLGFSIRF